MVRRGARGRSRSRHGQPLLTLVWTKGDPGLGDWPTGSAGWHGGVMHETPTGHPLEQFRRAAYQTLGPRKDSLFELMEAALASSGPATLARLSLAPGFRRGWASAPDALAAGG